MMDRYPFPFIEMNPQDMAELNIKAGDLVEVLNENGATQAMIYPSLRAKRNQTFMLFANPMGVQGNVVSKGVNEFIIPNYKQTWANIRKLADAPEAVKGLSFKSKEYSNFLNAKEVARSGGKRPLNFGRQKFAGQKKRRRPTSGIGTSVWTGRPRRSARSALEHISVWVNRGDSQGNLDERVFGDRFGILETIDVEALFFGPARAGG